MGITGGRTSRQRTLRIQRSLVRPLIAVVIAGMMVGCSSTASNVDSYRREVRSGLQEVSDQFNSLNGGQASWLKHPNDLPDGFSQDTREAIVAESQRCEEAARLNRLPRTAPDELSALHMRVRDVIGKVWAACQESITVLKDNDAQAFFAIDLASVSADLAALMEEVGQ